MIKPKRDPSGLSEQERAMLHAQYKEFGRQMHASVKVDCGTSLEHASIADECNAVRIFCAWRHGREPLHPAYQECKDCKQKLHHIIDFGCFSQCSSRPYLTLA